MKRWTNEEDSILYKYYNIKNKEWIEERLDRTWVSIKKRSYKLGIVRNGGV